MKIGQDYRSLIILIVVVAATFASGYWAFNEVTSVNRNSYLIHLPTGEAIRRTSVPNNRFMYLTGFVTIGEYRMFLSASGYRMSEYARGSIERLALVCQKDALAYCRWHNLALPDSADWVLFDKYEPPPYPWTSDPKAVGPFFCIRRISTGGSAN